MDLLQKQILSYPGMQFFAAYEETKAASEKEALDAYAGQNAPWNAKTEYCMLPFLVKYETEYNKRARYSDLVQWIKAYDEKEKPSEGSYLKTLIDTLSIFDSMIYEHYEALQSTFKAAVRRALERVGEKEYEEQLSADERIRTAYAIVRGCRMKALLAERYLPLAKAIAESADSKADEELYGLYQEILAEEMLKNDV